MKPVERLDYQASIDRPRLALPDGKRVAVFIVVNVENWEIERMAVVDRNILRQGIFELLWGADVPPKVAINEALEVAKKFSTQESSRFINGILDRIHKELRPSG